MANCMYCLWAYIHTLANQVISDMSKDIYLQMQEKSHTNVTIACAQVNEMNVKAEIKHFYIPIQTPTDIQIYPNTRNNILIDESNFGIRRKFAIRIVLCLNIKFKCVIIFSRNLLYATAAATAAAAVAHTLRDLCCVWVCVGIFLFFHLLLHLRHRIRLFCLVVACNIIRNTNNGNNNNPKLLMYSTKILYDKICTYINRFGSLSE